MKRKRENKGWLYRRFGSGAFLFAICVVTWNIPFASSADNGIKTDPSQFEHSFSSDFDSDGKKEIVYLKPRQKREKYFDPYDRAGCWKNATLLYDLCVLEIRGRKLELFEICIGINSEYAGTYWRHEIQKAEDVNGDGLTDIVYYAGDDTSEAFVTCLNKGDHFKIIFSGSHHLRREIGNYWDKKLENYKIGEESLWVIEKKVAIHQAANKESKIISWLIQDDSITVLEQLKVEGYKYPWYKTQFRVPSRTDGTRQVGSGWIYGAYVSKRARVKTVYFNK